MKKVYDLSNAPVAAANILDRSRLCALQGPVGSGKSAAQCIKLEMIASEQAPRPHQKGDPGKGLRFTRWAVVRNTTKQLKKTTLKTWLDWFPNGVAGTWWETDKIFELGVIYNGRKKSYVIPWVDEKGRADGTWVAAEIHFMGLDKPGQASDLLSLELTGAWVNEYREIQFDLFMDLLSRCGRFPAASDGGATWRGLICDTNPPGEDSGYYKVFEEGAADTEYETAIFKQPSGLSAEAENLENLEQGDVPKGSSIAIRREAGRRYYENLIKDAKYRGRGEDWTNVHVKGEYGSVVDGKPVYKEFYSDSAHKSRASLTYNPAQPLGIGIDFGFRFCAMTVGQKWDDGVWRLYREMVIEQRGLEYALKELNRLLQKDFRMSVGSCVFADPAGKQKSQDRGISQFEQVRAAGYMVKAGPQDPEIRVQSVIRALNIGLKIDPSMKVTIAGFAGGYRYRRMQTSDEQYSDKPEKNKYSHPHDALQYLVGWHEAPTLKNLQARETPNVYGFNDNRYGHAQTVGLDWHIFS